jgi:hypothetical protein
MILGFIFDKLGIDLNPANTDPILLFSLGFLVLSIIILLCFFNTSLYYVSIIMIKDYEEKLNNYPKFKKLLIYYSKFRLTYLIMEFILGIICCLIIIISCLLILGILVF